MAVRALLLLAFLAFAHAQTSSNPINSTNGQPETPAPGPLNNGTAAPIPGSPATAAPVAPAAAMNITLYPNQTSFYTPNVPQQKLFSTLGLTSGSLDVPLTDPRFAPGNDTTAPEQIHLNYGSPTNVVISWVTGAAVLNQSVLLPPNVTVPSTVIYGTSPTALTLNASGNTTYYQQIYTAPGSYNYTSGVIHHTNLTGLTPNTTYYYRVLGTTNVPSALFNFTTLQAVGPTFQPYRIAMVADLGSTYNSTATFDHLTASNPNLVVLIADFIYADNFCSNGSQNVAPITGCTNQTYQPKWDGFFRWTQPLFSRVPLLGIMGNHEIESQNPVNSTTFVLFQSYLARTRFPTTTSGTQLYYSTDVPGAHMIFLNPYTDYNASSAQLNWLQKDLSSYNRTNTPWLLVFFHPPIYNTYNSHFKEVECFRLAVEPTLYAYGVDIAMHGHVHAYERTNRVYNYTVNACAPAYITIGDGGNIEQVAANFTDPPSQCPANTGALVRSGFIGNCATYQTADNGSYCPLAQPAWSAYREPSFGHGTLDIINSTTAIWNWHRNQDGVAVAADAVTYTRPLANQCSNHLQYANGTESAGMSVVTSRKLLWEKAEASIKKCFGVL